MNREKITFTGGIDPAEMEISAGLFHSFQIESDYSVADLKMRAELYSQGFDLTFTAAVFAARQGWGGHPERHQGERMALGLLESIGTVTANAKTVGERAIYSSRHVEITIGGEVLPHCLFSVHAVHGAPLSGIVYVEPEFEEAARRLVREHGREREP